MIYLEIHVIFNRVHGTVLGRTFVSKYCSYRRDVPPKPDAVLVPLDELFDELRFLFRTGDGLKFIFI